MNIQEQDTTTPPAMEGAGSRKDPDHQVAMDALKISLIYLVFGILWIIFSDKIFLSLADRPEEVILISSVKGVLFIIVTTILLFLLIRYFFSQLQDRDLRLNAMAANIPGVVYRFHANPDGTQGFDYISERSRQVLGLENDPATFFDEIVQRIIPEDRERFLSSVRQAVSTKSLWVFESWYLDPSGRKLWLSAVSSPLVENDRLVFDGVIFDTTARKRAEEELIRKNEELNASYEQIAAAEEELRGNLDEMTRSEVALRRVNQKLGVLSQLTRQDLITQIYILNSYLELAKMQAGGSAGITANIANAERAVRSIREITEFTKDYQNVGTKPPKWQNVKLAFLLGLSHISTGTIRHSLETEHLEIFSDQLLEKAFQGLLENSVQHGGHVTEIRVSYTAAPEGITIIFEDDGTGIPPAKKEQIFSHTEGSRSSLRGLSFVREILDITGITIRETGRPGEGARFEMTVPATAYRFNHG